MFSLNHNSLWIHEIGFGLFNFLLKYFKRRFPFLFSPLCSSSLLLFDQIELVRRDYVANGGWETFLSYEDPEQDILVGLLRLRKCSEESFRPELKGGVSIVRELHVYGSVVPVSSRDPSKFQHQVLQTIFIFHLRLFLAPCPKYNRRINLFNIIQSL